MVVVSRLGCLLLVCLTSLVANAQSSPRCPESGAVVIAWHSIARQARTYALIQLPRGINQSEALNIARRCQFAGKSGYLAEFGNADNSEWSDVKSRFGAKLGGQRVENIWVAAGLTGDGYVRWYQSGSRVTNISAWRAWSPNEPQYKTAVTFHAGYPGLFNSCHWTDRYTRLLVEFR